MISVVICSCLNKPEREEYLKRCVDNLRSILGDEIEILIGFDKHGKDIDGAKCYTHDKGMGHSFNWGIQNASFDDILQIEDDWIIEIGGNNMERVPDKEAFFYHFENRLKVLNERGGIFKFTNIDDSQWSPGKTDHILQGYEFKELNRSNVFRYGSWEMYIYSNQPHMKKKDFHDKVGYFLENAPPDKVEVDMCKKVFDSGEPVFLCPFFTLIHVGMVQSR